MAAAAIVLLIGLAVLVHALLPSDEQLAADLSEHFEKASGISLRLGAAHWALRPSPVVVLEDLATGQPKPITVRRLVIRPRLAALWKRTIAIDSVEIDGAVFPRASVRAFRGRWKVDAATTVLAGAWTVAETPIERVRLRDVVWIDRREIALAYDADIRFDPHWRPREAQLSRPAVASPAVLRVEREGDQDRWRALIDVGGGTWNGTADLRVDGQGHLRLTAQLEPKNVDVNALLRSFGRHSVVDGKFQGQTSLDAQGENVTELIRSLHTRTRFSVAPATLNGFDLARTVRTGGSNRDGQTRLDSLTGTLDTQATDEGVVLRYVGLKARSGALTASGNATVINRRLDGEAAVDIVDGVVGVPLKLGGTLDNPQLSLTGAALAGAAVGTAVLPGAGTALGARIGQEMDKLLGNEDAAKKKGQRSQDNPKRR